MSSANRLKRIFAGESPADVYKELKEQSDCFLAEKELWERDLIEFARERLADDRN